jgi:hypothetical protein
MRIATVCALLLAPSLAAAEAGDPLSDRFSLSLGTFLLDTSTTLRVDGTGGRRGTEIDAERDLGLHNSDSFRVDGYWRFAERHKVRLLYFDNSRHDSRTIDRDITIRDTTFPLDAQVDTHFTTTVAELAYEYAFLRREHYEVAGTIGLHNLQFKLGLTAQQTSTGGAVAELAQNAKADGPLPVIGLRGIWRLGEQWALDAQAQFFRIKVDPYDGRLEDYTASVVWMPFTHVGLGAGYNEFVTRLDVSANQFEGRLRWRYGGARIFVTASF